MRTEISHDGPGPLVLRVDPDNEALPVGSALLDFHPERTELSILASNSAEEAVVRARVDAWALEHVGGLLQRLASSLTLTVIPGSHCGNQRAGQSDRGSR